LVGAGPEFLHVEDLETKQILDPSTDIHGPLTNLLPLVSSIAFGMVVGFPLMWNNDWKNIRQESVNLSREWTSHLYGNFGGIEI